jgi:hypothetical protein
VIGAHWGPRGGDIKEFGGVILLQCGRRGVENGGLTGGGLVARVGCGSVDFFNFLIFWVWECGFLDEAAGMDGAAGDGGARSSSDGR